MVLIIEAYHIHCIKQNLKSLSTASSRDTTNKHDMTILPLLHNQNFHYSWKPYTLVTRIRSDQVITVF